MDLGLKNKVAVVTGSGSQKGYGKGTAMILAKEGCNLIVADIDLEGAEKTAEEIKNLGREAIAVKVDITNKEQVNEMVKTALDRYGKIDILVNNAGADSTPRPFIERPEDEWDKDLAINLRGMLLCTKAVLPQMIERKQGKIVNISSIATKTPAPHVSIYSAAKCGVVGFSRALAAEVIGSGINVNCVAPGFGLTNFVKDTPREFLDILIEQTPAKTTTTPEDIGNMVAFLVSDVSKNILGQNISVDGGLSMI